MGVGERVYYIGMHRHLLEVDTGEYRDYQMSLCEPSALPPPRVRSLLLDHETSLNIELISRSDWKKELWAATSTGSPIIVFDVRRRGSRSVKKRPHSDEYTSLSYPYTTTHVRRDASNVWYPQYCSLLLALPRYSRCVIITQMIPGRFDDSLQQRIEMVDRCGYVVAHLGMEESGKSSPSSEGMMTKEYHYMIMNMVYAGFVFYRDWMGFDACFFCLMTRAGKLSFIHQKRKQLSVVHERSWGYWLNGMVLVGKKLLMCSFNNLYYVELKY